MFIGHFAPAFIAAAHIKSGRDEKAPGLGTFFVAAQLVDFGFFIFTLLGIEKMRITPGISAMNPMDLYHMPYTHSLLGSVLWAVLFGGLVYLVTQHKRGAILAGLVVLSHWFLDFLVHIPDLTMAGGDDKIGLGLWNHPWIAVALEVGVIAFAFNYYVRHTEHKRGTSRWPLRIMLIFLAGLQVFNWFAPPPPEFTAEMPISALLAFTVLAILAAWMGKSRTTKQQGLL